MIEHLYSIDDIYFELIDKQTGPPGRHFWMKADGLDF